MVLVTRNTKRKMKKHLVTHTISHIIHISIHNLYIVYTRHNLYHLYHLYIDISSPLPLAPVHTSPAFDQCRHSVAHLLGGIVTAPMGLVQLRSDPGAGRTQRPKDGEVMGISWTLMEYHWKQLRYFTYFHII